MLIYHEPQARHHTSGPTILLAEIKKRLYYKLFVISEKMKQTQVSALCGVHTLNTLMQGPYFSEVDLATIGTGLDAIERSMMEEGGVDNPDFLRFLAEDSGNVAADGNFSIQACPYIALQERAAAPEHLPQPKRKHSSPRSFPRRWRYGA